MKRIIVAAVFMAALLTGCGTPLRVGLPFGIGCGLAGGDWSVVSRAIEETVPQAVLYRL